MSTTKVTLILDGEEVSFEMSKDEVVLDVALSNGIDVLIRVKEVFVLHVWVKLKKEKQI